MWLELIALDDGLEPGRSFLGTVAVRLVFVAIRSRDLLATVAVFPLRDVRGARSSEMGSLHSTLMAADYTLIAYSVVMRSATALRLRSGSAYSHRGPRVRRRVH